MARPFMTVRQCLVEKKDAHTFWPEGKSKTGLIEKYVKEKVYLRKLESRRVQVRTNQFQICVEQK